MSTPNNKTTIAEYTHTLTEAQTRLEALTTTFAMFIDEHKDPDILGLQCVIDDADRLAGTVRQLYQLTKNGKAAQQPEPTRPAENKTDQANDPRSFDPAAEQLHTDIIAVKDKHTINDHEEAICIFAPDFSHRHLCNDTHDVFGFFQSISRAVLTTKSILNLNRQLDSCDERFSRDDAYYSLIAAKMNIGDIRAISQAMHEAKSTSDEVHNMIDDMTDRVLDELDPLCDLLAEDKPIQAGLIRKSLDSIIEEIEKLKMVEADSGTAKNRA